MQICLSHVGLVRSGARFAAQGICAQQHGIRTARCPHCRAGHLREPSRLSLCVCGGMQCRPQGSWWQPFQFGSGTRARSKEGPT